MRAWGSCAAAHAPTLLRCRRYEGPRCDQDINECVRGTSGCHPNATCTNAAGGYACHCRPDWSGDGFSCSYNAVAHRSMQQGYLTEGAGRLACSEGAGVLYPEAAPGFAYDPTGALELQPDTKASCMGAWGLRVGLWVVC